MTYDIGDTARITAVFAVGNVNTDPTTVTFTVRPPKSTETTYTYGVGPVIVRDSVGTFHADIALSVSRKWGFRWAGTGAAAGAGEGTLFVRDSNV